MNSLPNSTEGSEVLPAGAHWTQMFRALRHRNFRLYWIGLSVSLVGTWMQTIAQGWLAYQITDSPLMLGVINVVALIPVVPVSLIAGVISDHFSRRTIVLISETVLLIQALLLAVLTQFGVINIWHLIILSFIYGAASALEQPARLAMVSDMVGKEDLSNAVALNASVFNIARIIGPALAGLLVAITGSAGCFYINAASYFIAIIALLIIRIPNSKEIKVKQRMGKSLMGGVKYVWKTQTIRSLMVIVAVTSFFSLSYVAMLTIFAKDILKAGPTGLGFLMTAVGIGAISGALLVASLKSGRRGQWLIWGNLLGSLFLIIFCLSHSLIISLVLMFLVGMSNTIRQTLANSLLQIITPEDFQGRVMSLFNIFFNGMSRLGNLAIGGLAEFTGITWAVGMGGAVCLVWSVIIFWQMKDVRNLA